MKVFVTGADGFIGSHLVEALRDRGDDVTGLALYNSFDSFGWMDEIDGIRKVRGDIRDAEQMRALTAGHDIVFHLAALISVPHSYDCPRAYLDTNVTGTLSVLMAARDAGAKVVHTSTSEVYGTAQYTPMDEKHPINPQSPYAASKVAADALARSFALSYGMEIVTLRPFNTYGPRQSERAIVSTLVRQFLDPACAVVEIGNGDAARDLTYVADTVSAFLHAAGTDEPGPWNAGTGTVTTVMDLARIVSDATRVRKPVVTSQDRMRPEASEVRALVCDATAFRSATGWRPGYVPLSRGLDETIEWWRSRTPRRDMAYVA